MCPNWLSKRLETPLLRNMEIWTETLEGPSYSKTSLQRRTNWGHFLGLPLHLCLRCPLARHLMLGCPWGCMLTMFTWWLKHYYIYVSTLLYSRVYAFINKNRLVLHSAEWSCILFIDSKYRISVKWQSSKGSWTIWWHSNPKRKRDGAMSTADLKAF